MLKSSCPVCKVHSNGYNRMVGIIMSGFYLGEGRKVLADLLTAPFLNEDSMKGVKNIIRADRLQGGYNEMDLIYLMMGTQEGSGNTILPV